MKFELNECPRCKGKAKLRRGLPSINMSKDIWAMVQCTSCFCRTITIHQQKNEKFVDVAHKAVDLWNSNQVQEKRKQ